MSPSSNAAAFVPTSAWDDPLRVPDDFVVPTPAQLLEMPLEARKQQLMLLQSYDSEFGTDHVGAYRRERSRCTDVDEFGARCPDERFTGIMHCLRHATVDELNPSGATERRVRAAKLRMVDKLDTAVDRLLEIIDAPPEEVTAQVRLNAITTLFDRGGLPKETRQEIDSHVEVTTPETAGATVRARIEQLRNASPAQPGSPEPARNGETPQSLTAVPDDVVEGVLVDD